MRVLEHSTFPACIFDFCWRFIWTIGKSRPTNGYQKLPDLKWVVSYGWRECGKMHWAVPEEMSGVAYHLGPHIFFSLVITFSDNWSNCSVWYTTLIYSVYFMLNFVLSAFHGSLHIIIRRSPAVSPFYTLRNCGADKLGILLRLHSLQVEESVYEHNWLEPSLILLSCKF